MLNKITEYFETIYADTKRAIDNGYKYSTPTEMVNRGISDCLAVAMFGQTIGCTYDEINPLYEEIKERLQNLL